SQYIQQKISDLFQDRFLFVQRHLTPSERKRFLHITRGLPQLRTLRAIMEHMYALFDRRCRTQSALGKLKKLRQWVKRFTWMGETKPLRRYTGHAGGTHDSESLLQSLSQGHFFDHDLAWRHQRTGQRSSLCHVSLLRIA